MKNTWLQKTRLWHYLFCLMRQRLCYFAFKLNTIAGSGHRTSTICKETRVSSLQFTQGRQEATKSMPPLKLYMWKLANGLSCCRCHNHQLDRLCISNLSCDYFNQLCLAKEKIAPAVFLPLLSKTSIAYVFFYNQMNLGNFQNRWRCKVLCWKNEPWQKARKKMKQQLVLNLKLCTCKSTSTWKQNSEDNKKD